MRNATQRANYDKIDLHQVNPIYPPCTMRESIAIIVVAAGSGTRMGAELPKQFLPIAGRPLLMHTLERLHEALPAAQLIVVVSPTEMERWQSLCTQHAFSLPHTLCEGGEHRFASVQRGLVKVADAEFVAVHDGVRPFTSVAMIHRCVEVASEHGTAIPVVEVSDSLREVEPKPEQAAPLGALNGVTEASHPVDRARFRAVQTPQLFRHTLLERAYKQPYQPTFTDDASVVEALGERVTLCAGEPSNLKITTPLDMAVAEVLLTKERL